MYFGALFFDTCLYIVNFAYKRKEEKKRLKTDPYSFRLLDRSSVIGDHGCQLNNNKRGHRELLIVYTLYSYNVRVMIGVILI